MKLIRSLTREQQQQTARLYPLARKIAADFIRANKVKRQNQYDDDVYSAAALGLIQAVQQFDPRKQSSFVHYLYIKVHSAIRDTLRAILPKGYRRACRRGARPTPAIHSLGEHGVTSPPEFLAQPGELVAALPSPIREVAHDYLLQRKTFRHIARTRRLRFKTIREYLDFAEGHIRHQLAR
jgi:RNA polymerase sigma factor (sigma-70 family)